MVDNHFDRCTTPIPELFCFVFLLALCISITLSNQSYTKILHDPPASTSQNQNFRVCLPGCCSKLMLREHCLWNSDSGTLLWDTQWRVPCVSGCRSVCPLVFLSDRATSQIQTFTLLPKCCFQSHLHPTPGGEARLTAPCSKSSSNRHLH